MPSRYEKVSEAHGPCTCFDDGCAACWVDARATALRMLVAQGWALAFLIDAQDYRDHVETARAYRRAEATHAWYRALADQIEHVAELPAPVDVVNEMFGPEPDSED